MNDQGHVDDVRKVTCSRSALNACRRMLPGTASMRCAFGALAAISSPHGLGIRSSDTTTPLTATDGSSPSLIVTVSPVVVVISQVTRSPSSRYANRHPSKAPYLRPRAATVAEVQVLMTKDCIPAGVRKPAAYSNRHTRTGRAATAGADTLPA